MDKFFPSSEHAAVTPDPDAGFGALQTSKGPLPLKALDVKATIVGLITRTTVSQTFVNTHREPLEAVYIFPLPPREAVSAFSMRVGGKLVLGKLFERGQARQKYSEALREGKRAALAEEDRPNVFTLSVGNLMPGDVAEITFEMVGLLGLEGGEAQWRFPLVVAPRYIPGTPLEVDQAGLGISADTDEVPDASRLNPPTLLPGYPNPVRLGIEVLWDPAGLPIQDIRSTLHAITETTSDGRTRLRLAHAERLDRDFVLRGTFTPTEVWGSALLVPDEKGIEPGPDGSTGTLMVTVLPPDLDPASKAGRDVVFLLDHSGSMDGWKMAAARRAMARMVEILGPADRFQVVRFDTHTTVFEGEDRLLPATDLNRFKAMGFLTATLAQGGTEISVAIRKALEILGPPVPEREAIVFLVTDGQVGNEDKILGLLGGQGTHCRFQIIGVDEAANESLLMRLAMATRGWFLVSENEQVLDQVLLTAKRKFGNPRLTDLRIVAPSVGWLPETLVSTGGLDLYPGTPVILTARYLKAEKGAAITLEGQKDGLAGFARTYEVRTVQEPALRSIWARFRLREMEDALARDPRLSDAEQQMTDISLKFCLLSRFTAWLAVEEAAVVNPGGVVATILQPVELPRGWQEQSEPEACHIGGSYARACQSVSVPSIIRMTAARGDDGDEALDLLDFEPTAPSISPAPAAPATQPSKVEARSSSPRSAAPFAEHLLRFLGEHEFTTLDHGVLRELTTHCMAVSQFLDDAMRRGDQAARELHRACEAILRLYPKPSLSGRAFRTLQAAIQKLELALKAYLGSAATNPGPRRKFWSILRR